MSRIAQIVLVMAAAGSLAGANAQELKIGLSAEPSAMDPHFHNLTPNNSLLKHVFDRLTDQDENQAGQRAADSLLQVLDKAGLKIRLVGLPVGHDPNSYFLAGASAEDFAHLLEEAPSL